MVHRQTEFWSLFWYETFQINNVQFYKLQSIKRVMSQIIVHRTVPAQ